jgi:hypothetical protein
MTVDLVFFCTFEMLVYRDAWEVVAMLCSDFC